MKKKPVFDMLILLLLLGSLTGFGCGVIERQGITAPATAGAPAPPSGGVPPVQQPPPPPAPTSTSVPGACTDAMQFVADVTVPDGTVFGPNEPFVKTWRVRNAGSCNWSGYRVAFSDGEPMGTMEQPIPDTSAGQEVEISVEMTAPGGAGNYTGRWQVESPTGANLGTLTCVITVEGEEVAPPGGGEVPPGGEEAPPGGGEAQQPDLEIGEVSVWVPMPTDPKKVAVTIEVRNIGSGPAGAFTVRWYPHQKSNEVGCSLDVMGLGAGVSQILDDCPSYTYGQQGEMHWRAIVDEDNEIQNDPKGNNEARGTIRIGAGGGGGQQPQPDLVITEAYFEQGGQRVEQVVQGQPFNAVFKTANHGNAPAGPFTVVWHFHEVTGLKNCCSRDMTELAAGGWGGGTFGNLMAPAQVGESPAWVEIDAGNRVDEGQAGEGNNRFDLRFVVAAGQPSGQPDLVIMNLMITPEDTVKPGEHFGVTFLVANRGNAPAGPSTAHWRMAGSTGLSCDCHVPAVGPGDGYHCDCAPLVAPSAPKNYGTWAIADYGKVVAESNEDNNKSESAVLKVHQ